MGNTKKEFLSRYVDARSKLSNVITNAIRFHWLGSRIEHEYIQLATDFPQATPQKYLDMFNVLYRGMMWTLYQQCHVLTFDKNNAPPVSSWLESSLDSRRQFKFHTPITIRVWPNTDYVFGDTFIPDHLLNHTDTWTIRLNLQIPHSLELGFSFNNPILLETRI